MPSVRSLTKPTNTTKNAHTVYGLSLVWGLGPKDSYAMVLGRSVWVCFGMVSGRARSYLGVVRPLERYLGNSVQNGVRFVSSAQLCFCICCYVGWCGVVWCGVGLKGLNVCLWSSVFWSVCCGLCFGLFGVCFWYCLG